MSVHPDDNYSRCIECREKYEDQVIGKHPQTGEPICPSCAEEMRCADCKHIGCQGVTVCGVCMECTECDLYDLAAA